MSTTNGSGDGGADPRTRDWDDSGAIAVITWQDGDGRTVEREIARQDDAADLLRTIENDPGLTLISAQRRRRGIGPAS
jgi:hypothetical protein